MGIEVALRRARSREHIDPAELATLADGSATPVRRAALEAEVEASPELAEQLAEQRRAVSRTRAAASQTGAPAGLRARIDASRPAPRAHGSGRLLFGGIAFAAAVVAAFVVTRRARSVKAG
jgi:anti-sigma factor RsiW